MQALSTFADQQSQGLRRLCQLNEELAPLIEPTRGNESQVLCILQYMCPPATHRQRSLPLTKILTGLVNQSQLSLGETVENTPVMKTTILQARFALTRLIELAVQCSLLLQFSFAFSCPRA